MGCVEKLKASEKRISRDIYFCLKQNDLGEMFDIEMIDEYIQELTSNCRNYLDVHDDLHEALCTDEHDKLYPNIGEILDRLNSEIKKAKAAKYRLKQKHEEAKEEAREERLRKEQKEREERFRKEQEAKIETREERLRKERRGELLRQEEKEVRRRKEKEEKEERLRKEHQLELEEKARKDLESKEILVRDEIGLCLCKIETILTNFSISKIILVEDIKLNLSKISD